MRNNKTTFLDIAKKVLDEEKRAMSPDEIWQTVVLRNYDRLINSKGKTPWSSLGSRLYVDVRDNSNTIFKATDTRPKKFYLKTECNEDYIQETDQQTEILQTKTKYKEKDLHPFLVYYGFHYLKAYIKTINAQRSDKKEFGEWVHPDLVGCYFSFQEWKDEVVAVSSSLGYSPIRLYSFELIKGLNFSNLREAFFQAVSNSSWANEGYLVAAEIESNDDFMNEIKRLSASFGIGVIHIDVDDPDSTNIILPAKFKENVDWETVNKLTINPDFSEFLKRVKNDISTREVRKEQYDEVKSKDELLESIKP